MKTDALIELLARDAGPAPRALAARRLSPAALGGGLLSAVVAIALFGAVPWSSFSAFGTWLKLGYAVVLAAAAGWLTARLSRPAARFRPQQWLTVAVVGVMAVIGLAAWWATPADARAQAVFGSSWLSCPWRVLLLSLPALAAALWAVRGLAPTRPGAAGFAAGLLAGAVGAFGYALSCPESSPAFVAVWYTSGVLLTGALGAALGPRCLRW